MGDDYGQTQVLLFSSLLFSSLLFVFVAFFLISCEDALTPLDNSPSQNGELQGENDVEPLIYGYWRIEGVIDAPLDWDPTEDSDLLQIWVGGAEPWYEFTQGCTFNLVMTGQTSKRWHFKTNGDYSYEWDTWNVYFIPPADWWSHPDEGTPTFRRTWVQGYRWVEFGGGFHLVLADEEWSYNPKNYEDGIPRVNWKYFQPYRPGCTYYWAWTTVYLDLTD